MRGFSEFETRAGALKYELCTRSGFLFGRIIMVVKLIQLDYEMLQLIQL